MKTETSFIDQNTSPLFLFYSGAFLLPAFLMQSMLVCKAVCLICYVVLARLKGVKLKPVFLIVFTISVCGIHLLIPAGKVLVSILGFKVTEGSLYLGLNRSLTFIGLYYLSRSIISKSLIVPGRFGKLVMLSFYYFEKIIGEKIDIKRGDLFSQIDQILLGVSAQTKHDSIRLANSKTSLFGYFLLVSLIILTWGLLFLGNMSNLG